MPKPNTDWNSEEYVTTQRLIWTPTSVIIDLFRGTGTSGPVLMHSEWTDNIPVPYRERMVINVWVINEGSGAAATCAPSSYVLRDFTFEPTGNTAFDLNIVGDTFEWKGFTWLRRDYGGNPTFNGQYDPANVSDPDADDYVTISISNPSGNSPYAGEMISDLAGTGYGTYTLVVGTRLDQLPAGTVFGGLFTYDDQTAVHNNEIDVCEVSAWDIPGGPILIYQTRCEDVAGVKHFDHFIGQMGGLYLPKHRTDWSINSSVDPSEYDASDIDYDDIDIYYDDVTPGESPIETKAPVDWTPSYGD